MPNECVHYPQNCRTNYLVSLTNRVLSTTPPVKPNGNGQVNLALQCTAATVKMFGYKLPKYQQLTDDQLIATFPVHKKKEYLRAMKIPELSKQDRKTMFFIKQEKLDCDKEDYRIDGKAPDPRGIFAGSKKVNIEMKRRLAILEHDLFSLEGDGKTLPYGRIFAKGLNSHQRYDMLKTHWDSFVEPVCVKLDMSRWDKHFNNTLRKLEHDMYMSKFKGDRLFRRLLKWQKEIRGYGYAGSRQPENKFTFRVEGIQPSGCVNTGLGNSLIVTSIIWAYCKHNGINARLCDDGDDILVLCEKRQEGRLNKLDSWCNDLGIKLTLENIVYKFNEIVFCQCRPFNQKMVRSPSRVLGRAFGGRTGWGKNSADMFTSVGLCEYIANRGVPVVSRLMYQAYKHGLSVGGHFNAGLIDDYKREEHLIGMNINKSREYVYIPPNIAERERFVEDYGCSVEEQLRLEELISKVEFVWEPPQVQSVYITLMKHNFSDLQNILHQQFQL